MTLISALREGCPRCTVHGMRTLAIVNQKGGVGKTTVTLNLAAALVERDLRVLVVDMDPQGYATAGLGAVAKYDRTGISLASHLLGDVSGAESPSRLVWWSSADRIALIPSNLDMFTVESRMTSQRARELRLRQILAPLADGYDYCLIDCPASLGPLTDNAIVAAGEVLVPMLADGLSLRALELLLDQIDSIRTQLAVDVRLVGLVVNQWAETNAAARVDEDLDALGLRVLARIRKRVAATNAWEAGRSAVTADPKGYLAEAFRELAQAVVETEGE